MSLIFSLSRNILNFVARKQVSEFEEALKNPEVAQALLLKRWKKKQTHREKILNFEYTSGSSGIKKKIGYTKSLKSSFSSMFQLWAFDVLNNAPMTIKSGVIYMSISPRINDHGGLDNDAEYISPFLRLLTKKFLAVDPQMQRAATGEDFYFQLSKEILSRQDLEIISIWSPTYFLNLLEFIKLHQKTLGFTGHFKDWWPNLKMISAWSSGESQNSFLLLQKEFPNVWFQGKGLLATEGPMTIPWIKADGFLPLINHTYFEFLDSSQNKLLIHQLKIGETYEIIPRFPNQQLPTIIEDMVVCTGYYKNTPLLNFIGRKGDASDLVGEKLSGNILRDIFTHKLGYFIFIPTFNPITQKHFYSVFVDQQNTSDFDIDEKLQTIHHYKLARELNQLGPIQLIYIKNLKNEIKSIQLELGIREGDQKDYTIVKRPEIQKKIFLLRNDTKNEF